MKLFEATNGSIGESYVRCYVWAESEARGRELVQTKYGNGWSLELLLSSDDSEFVTAKSDCGFRVL